MGSKHSLLMKYDQFMLYYIIYIYIKILQKMRTETSPRLFCVCKELEAQPLLEIEIFQASYLH